MLRASLWTMVLAVHWFLLFHRFPLCQLTCLFLDFRRELHVWLSLNPGLAPSADFVHEWEDAVQLACANVVQSYGAPTGFYNSLSEQLRAVGLYAVSNCVQPGF